MRQITLDKQNLLLLIFIVFLLLTLPVALLVSRQRQDIRQRASSSSGTAIVQLNPGSGSNIAVGGTYPVTINVSATSTPENKGISGFRFVLSYSYPGATSPFQPVTIADIEEVFPDNANKWNVLKEVSTDGKTVTINGIFNASTGYDISTPKTFVRINFKPQNTGTVTVNFDASLSTILAKGGTLNTDILSTPTTPAGTYTVGGGSTPTPTTTGQPSPTPTATVIPTPTTTRPANAPTINRLSSYCGKVSTADLESVLVLYGSKFGATQGTSKVTFHYKSNSAATDYQDQDVMDYVSWSDTIVVVKVPAVTFPKDASGVDQKSVVSKVVITKAGFLDYPYTFPAIDNFAFFEITHSNPKNIADVNCSNLVNMEDYTVLFNNYDL